MSLGETAEQRAFRDGFNDGYEHGKNDQGDHFWEQNERLKAEAARLRAAIERFAGMARAGTTTDEGVRFWHVPAADLNALIQALVDPADVQSEEKP